MKLLLTSSGISNPSIEAALVELLGKPISTSSALVVASGIYPFPGGGDRALQVFQGTAKSRFSELGWRTLGVLELTALPSIQEESWVPTLRALDVLYVWGGDVLYLGYWMRRSGLADLLPSLDRLVYVGCSAGSIVTTPYNCDAAFDLQFVPPGHEMALEAERGLGLVDVAVCVHVDHPEHPDNSLAEVERWAAGIPATTYALDDDSALRVVDGRVDVVSEGRWWRLDPPGGR